MRHSHVVNSKLGIRFDIVKPDPVTIDGIEAAPAAVTQIKNTVSSYLNKVWNSARSTSATSNMDVFFYFEEVDNPAEQIGLPVLSSQKLSFHIIF